MSSQECLPGAEIVEPGLEALRRGELTVAKLERGFAQDLDDVVAMIAGGGVLPGRLAELFGAIRP